MDTSIPQMALEALEPFKRLSDKFDHRPYNDGYADALRINGTGDDSKADVVRIHNFLTLGDCRKAKQAFIALEKCLSENGPKSDAVVGVSSWCNVCGTPRSRHDSTGKCPTSPSPSPSEANAQQPMEETFLEWWKTVWNAEGFKEVDSRTAEKFWNALRPSTIKEQPEEKEGLGEQGDAS